MSNVKVLSYHPQPWGDYQLGFARVEMGGKCAFVVKVIKSKAGETYCAFQSVKIGEDWLPSFAFLDKDVERNFLNDCMAQLPAMMQPPKPEEQQQMVPPVQGQEGLPF